MQTNPIFWLLRAECVTFGLSTMNFWLDKQNVGTCLSYVGHLGVLPSWGLIAVAAPGPPGAPNLHFSDLVVNPECVERFRQERFMLKPLLWKKLLKMKSS